MTTFETEIPGVLIIEPQAFADCRGFFMELYRADRYAAYGLAQNFLQDNISRSSKGVLRGLHLQNPKPQGKLLTVLRGSVLDVAVDVRVDSPTFGRHVKVELSEENYRQLWVPRGFAHGFVVTSEIADIYYKCDDFYSPADELVLKWNDPQLGIEWGCDAPKVSRRDSEGRTLAQLNGMLPHYEPR